MAVEQVQQQTPHGKPMEFDGEVVEIDADGNVRKILITKPMPERFDKTFARDVFIAIALFAGAVIGGLIRAPIIGHPWALLVGPLVGVILTLRHRPAR
jgi:hypothetical protein